MHPPYCFAPGKKLTSSVPVKKGAVSLFALRDTMSTATANKIETSTGDPAAGGAKALTAEGR